jgi:hypothetical protein
MVNRRSPPTAMPITPISQPLITSPAPSLKPKGLPFLFAIEVRILAWIQNNRERPSKRGKLWVLTIKYLAIIQLANVAHLNMAALLRL